RNATGSLRVGAAGGATPRRRLQARLRGPFSAHLEAPCPPVRHWVIPLSPIRRTYADRVVAVGDAAGGVEDTPRGGGGRGAVRLAPGGHPGDAAAPPVVGAAAKEGSARQLSVNLDWWSAEVS